jgi:acylaminoacyl-peptidase
VTKALSSLSYTVLPLPQFSLTEILLLSPISISPSAPACLNLPPLLTVPHGGPHSTTSTEFSAMIACHALCGYRVAGVNYPGSTGFGQRFIDILPPLLGKLEVDAAIAVPHYLNTLSLASRTKGKNLFAGGSHRYVWMDNEMRVCKTDAFG